MANRRRSRAAVSSGRRSPGHPRTRRRTPRVGPPRRHAPRRAAAPRRGRAGRGPRRPAPRRRSPPDGRPPLRRRCARRRHRDRARSPPATPRTGRPPRRPRRLARSEVPGVAGERPVGVEPVGQLRRSGLAHFGQARRSGRPGRCGPRHGRGRGPRRTSDRPGSGCRPRRPPGARPGRRNGRRPRCRTASNSTGKGRQAVAPGGGRRAAAGRPGGASWPAHPQLGQRLPADRLAEVDTGHRQVQCRLLVGLQTEVREVVGIGIDPVADLLLGRRSASARTGTPSSRSRRLSRSKAWRRASCPSG